MDYISLVLCKHTEGGRLFLFQAPKWSGLEKGDKVVVETKKGEQVARVECVVDSIKPTEEEFDMIVRASEATLPLKKVISKIVYRAFNYEED